MVKQPFWNLRRITVLLSVIRPLVPASAVSVARMSSSLATSFVTRHPVQHFCLFEPPIFAKAIAWQAFCRSFARTSVDPRHGNLQQVRYFVNSQELGLIVFFSRCGRVHWRGMRRRLHFVHTRVHFDLL